MEYNYMDILMILFISLIFFLIAYKRKKTGKFISKI